jgi:S-adenosylmethionine-diacylglycerol 3-amino-3-carboxypropyl transferase
VGSVTAVSIRQLELAPEKRRGRTGARGTGATARPFRVRREIRLPSASAGRLFFAQVREDPLLEIEALAPAPDSTIVVVSSGGCTALSLVASGAGRVVSVDSNVTQNHLVELKAQAVRSLEPGALLGFLGATSTPKAWRIADYRALRGSLNADAAKYWDSHSRMIGNGVLNSGVSEGFIRIVVRAMRLLVHPASRIDRLLSCETVAEQRSLYENEWNTRRWRALLRILLSRRAFNRTYDPAFFQNVENGDFAGHFYRLMEHALCEIPVASNYFLHHMLKGTYRTAIVGGVPPYLDRAAQSATRQRLENLELVDGGYAEYLATCDGESVDGFALSNICEWLDEEQIRNLFAEVVRVARPGARLCFRNFVGHTDIPQAFRSSLREDVEAGRAAIKRDRSCLQARFVTCRVEK